MSGSFNYRRSRPRLVSPYGEPGPVAVWRRALGCLLLVMALGLLVAGAGLALTAPGPQGDAPTVVAATAVVSEGSVVAATAAVDEVGPGRADDAGEGPGPQSTLSADEMAALLSTPPVSMDGEEVLRNTGLSYDPFTEAAQRVRSRMTVYTVLRGDSVDSIAREYGISRETIAWCNSPRKAQVLYPGDALDIPPGDGACHTVLASQGKDIRAIAEQYGLEDPYAIIDSPANGLREVGPETRLPSGTRLFIPGGAGVIITWEAQVEEDGSGNVIAFARGNPNSCGAVPGGGTYWTNPLPNGTFVRGFYAGHSGIDLAAAPGTPIYAANGGPVLYAGWNSWGYGNTVVIGHGPFSTLYGHMRSLAARCGNVVSAGQVIGYVGSTGNSSGPHLHFEIRYRNQPQDPSQTLGIGW